jgi:hypothetical protein
VLFAPTPAHAQFGPRVGFTYQFGIQQNANFNPFAPFLPQVPGRFSFKGYTLSGVGATGPYSVSYGYYRNAALVPAYAGGVSVYDQMASLGTGSRGSRKMAAEQRSAVADAQRNAKWDSGATAATPDFDRWLKEAATRRESPDPKAPAIDPALADPPDEAVLSGEALNRLAELIRAQEKQGKKAASGLFAPELTTKIVFAGGAAADAGNLYRGADLRYPESLMGTPYEPLRGELDKAFGLVAKEAVAGKKTPAADVERLLKAIAKAHDGTRQAVADAPFADACEVCEFFGTLESATKYLKDDKSTGVAGADWSAVGATAGEVVKHLGKYGMTFGPARTGDDAAYFSVHRGLLAYYAGLLQAK